MGLNFDFAPDHKNLKDSMLWPDRPWWSKPQRQKWRLRTQKKMWNLKRPQNQTCSFGLASPLIKKTCSGREVLGPTRVKPSTPPTRVLATSVCCLLSRIRPSSVRMAHLSTSSAAHPCIAALRVLLARLARWDQILAMHILHPQVRCVGDSKRQGLTRCGVVGDVHDDSRGKAWRDDASDERVAAHDRTGHVLAFVSVFVSLFHALDNNFSKNIC